jgi:hypothetical protein
MTTIFAMCDSAVGVETQFPFQPAADGARSIAGRFGVPQAQPIAGGALAAENLFLRKQLALYLERKVNPTLLFFWKTRSLVFSPSECRAYPPIGTSLLVVLP